MNKHTDQTTLNFSEIEYVYTCWRQGYEETYPSFRDYLKIAIEGKRIKGTIYA